MFGTINIKSRPLKLAYLVDPRNANQVRKAIRLSSTLWGGAYFPIITLHKQMPATWREKPIKTPSPESVILGYVEAFDPDVFVQFSKEVPQCIDSLGLKIIKPDEIWKNLDGDGYLIPKFGVGIFELLNDIFEKNFKFKMKYPVEVIFPKIPRQYSLFWASLFGELSSEIIQQLEKNYFEPLQIKRATIDTKNIKQLISRNVLFPRRITIHGIKSYDRSGFGRNAYVYYLDAMKPDDVIDFWNLRAMGKMVMPMPRQFRDDPFVKELVVDFLKAHRRPWRHDPKVCDFASIVRARNCTMEEIQAYSKTLKIDHDPSDKSDDPFFSIQHWYPRVWDEWARDKDGAVPNDIYGDKEDSMEITDPQEFRFGFRSLLPKFAQQHSHHGEPRCANEISFRFYGSNEFIAEVFPKSSGENFVSVISGLTSFRGDWRVGRNGLVKLVKYDFNETRDVPLAERVFFAWLKDLGWESKLSPAGLLAQQIYRILEGHSAILTNEKLLGLLEHMNGGKVKKDGSPAEGDQINQERYLSIGELKSRLRGTSGRDNIYDFAIERGIFKIGLRVQCPHCSRNSWYATENIRDELTCPRCLKYFPAVGNFDGSGWCYKTAGPFSVPNYADGAYAVLLTLDFFDDRKMHTMRITPALSFIAEVSGKENIEADLAAFWHESIFGENQDGLLFGECKTYGIFKKKDFDRMRYIAKTFPGAILVFSTLRKSLSKKEIASITRIAKSGRKYWKAERPINPVLILTGNELLSIFGPPYCWQDRLKKKFEHFRGLIGLCDVTQQIYLNLPSWQTEWHQKWEKKRQRMKKTIEK
jgi:hypothetical protein